MSEVIVPFVDPVTRILNRESRIKERTKRLLERSHQQKIELIKNKKFTCEHCKEESLFGKLGFVYEHWFESPHGCNGGSEWHRHKIEICNIACPHCNTLNYIYNHKQKKSIVNYVNSSGVSAYDIFAVIYENHPTERDGLRLTQVHPIP